MSLTPCRALVAAVLAMLLTGPVRAADRTIYITCEGLDWTIYSDNSTRGTYYYTGVLTLTGTILLGDFVLDTERIDAKFVDLLNFAWWDYQKAHKIPSGDCRYFLTRGEADADVSTNIRKWTGKKRYPFRTARVVWTDLVEGQR